jgi:hypothetical protein
VLTSPLAGRPYGPIIIVALSGGGLGKTAGLRILRAGGNPKAAVTLRNLTLYFGYFGYFGYFELFIKKEKDRETNIPL